MAEQTAEQLRREKMEALDRFARGVADDLSALLVAINGYADFLADSLEDERERRFAAEIRAAGERGAALTRALLAFSRRQPLRPAVISLNDEVCEAEPSLRHELGDDVRIVLDLDRRLPAVEADPAQIRQVLRNLALNARDAMAGNGTLTIATRSGRDEAVLEVTDTGTGMDEANRTRIFEPFFTTKLGGHASGLGLSTAYGIVAQTGGTISVRSTRGAGATFTIRLPAATRVT